MQLTKRIGIIHIGTQKAPELLLRSFSIPLGKVAYTLGWRRLFVPFQPFADKVANNTCQYRDNECNNSFHGVSPPLYRKGSRLLYIITSP